MLLDEPFGALDPLTRDRIQQSFRRIRARLGLTAIFVTHDMRRGAAARRPHRRDGRLGACCRSARRASCSPPADEVVRQCSNTASPGGGGRGAARTRRRAWNDRAARAAAVLPDGTPAARARRARARDRDQRTARHRGGALTAARASAARHRGADPDRAGLALLAVMVPVLAALGLRSIGFLPALVGLTLWGCCRSCATPSPASPASTRRWSSGARRRHDGPAAALPRRAAARAAGDRRRRPTATVWTVGMATLSTPVGARASATSSSAACRRATMRRCCSARLRPQPWHCCSTGWCTRIEVGVTRRRRERSPRPSPGSRCWSWPRWYPRSAARSRRARPVVIGAKTFTEQYVPERGCSRSGSSARRACRRRCARRWARRSRTTRSRKQRHRRLRRLLRNALGDDPEAHHASARDRASARSTRSRAFRAERDGASSWCATSASRMRMRSRCARDADRFGIRRIGDLTPHANKMTVGGDYEFFRVRRRAIREGLRAALRERAQRGPVASCTRPRPRRGRDQRVLHRRTHRRPRPARARDDRGAIPPYDAVVLASQASPREHPEAIEALRRLARTIDAPAMRAANLAVDEQGRAPPRSRARCSRISSARRRGLRPPSAPRSWVIQPSVMRTATASSSQRSSSAPQPRIPRTRPTAPHDRSTLRGITGSSSTCSSSTPPDFSPD